METLNQTYFRNNIKACLDQVNDHDEVIYITRPKNKAAVVISAEKMAELELMEQYTKAPEGSIDKGIAEDKLIQMGVLPESPEVNDNNWNEFWNQFKK
ncbi:type II toxin-antitoxin system Phd/YefM family antitoxin [Lactobacillus sp. ESL0679]|uniref:type II toxin-antitoxin system Phd/YefM family antitoxin n=1 Tax=Lactobacillus sp. ESL0679 TaxID=2983209 RepID=UPI0023F904F5|nr:type II toxin-antitoxin system Phd/YefM family antitoxin [Lactobacillus sp. ESL0679]MDF7683735.1 type II toxin-antitoxin system Phd/YefM family antitoxin [Lactobacillus sp. ESL0679]